MVECPGNIKSLGVRIESVQARACIKTKFGLELFLFLGSNSIAREKFDRPWAQALGS